MKAKAFFRRLLTTLLAFSLLLYVGYQAYRSLFSAVNTEMAISYSVYDSIETQGLIFRTETLIPQNTNGYAFYTVENGTRVAKDGIIASIYPNAGDGLIEQEMQEIDAQIATLKSIQDSGSSSRLTLDIINNQISTAVGDLIMDAGSSSFSDIGNMKTKLLALLNKKQIVTGKSVDFTAENARLSEKKSSLQAQFHAATAKLTAPVAGYFADAADGYETLLKDEDITRLTTTRLAELLATQPQPQANIAGKIVGGYEWYLACTVPESYYNSLSVDSALTVRLSFVSDDAIPVTVVACNKDNNGQLAVVFRCAYMSDALSTIRKETVMIQLVQHTGLKVPKAAIVIREDMQTGVYIRSGNIVSFRKIEQQFSEPADYVICTVNEDKSYLQLYDDVIVGGKGLYDGKIIH